MDSTKQMIGTFSPQPEPYILEIAEETTPSGMFARGSYSAKTKVNSLGHCHLLKLFILLFKVKLMIPIWVHEIVTGFQKYLLGSFASFLLTIIFAEGII